MFRPSDIADYYNTTQIHYEKWWNLNDTLSLHYGIWDKNTKTFRESLVNTNRVLMNISKISESDKILDAGCGVGGAAFFLNKEKKAQVVGITLSEKQLNTANTILKKRKLSHQISFQLMDFTQTTFKNESFDVVWACESMCHTPNNIDFITEAYRLLKKGGRLIVSDFFLTKDNQQDKYNWIKKWSDSWGISTLVSSDLFTNRLKETNFSKVEMFDFTQQIKKSAQRMYHASLLGAIPSEIYNLLHPNVSKFAKTHYKCGYYQYRALKQNLWKYNVFLAIK